MKLKTHGIAQLYQRGFKPKNVMKMMPKDAVGFAVYDSHENLIGDYQEVKEKI